MTFRDMTPVVTIKMTQSELELAIHSLNLITSLDVPIENHWLTPYKTLQSELININEKINEKVRDIQNDTKKEESYDQYSTTQVPQSCKACD